MKTKSNIEALLSPEAKRQLTKGLPEKEERKFQNLIKLMEKEGIPRCPTCFQPMKKIDEYSYKTACKCSRQKYKVMMG